MSCNFGVGSARGVESATNWQLYLLSFDSTSEAVFGRMASEVLDTFGPFFDAEARVLKGGPFAISSNAMPFDIAPDDVLLQRLPLPLAQIYRRAHNAKTQLERHLTAFTLWEASLKLLASVAIVEYAQRGEADPQLAERLQNLARPQLGHWWEFVRLLVPALADQGQEAFRQVRDLVLGRTRDDFPRAAGLDAALRQSLGSKAEARTTVRFTELFDRLVRYRNAVLAHAAPAQLKDDFNERMSGALLAGMAEILGRVDVLAGRRLLYIAEIRQVGGVWLVQRYELVGENARRIASLELPRTEAARLPDAERLYLDEPAAAQAEGDGIRLATYRSLHPLLVYDAEAEEVLFLNARRGQRHTEYLCYTTGRTVNRPDLGGEQRALLARVLGMAVDAGQAEKWAARSHAGEPASEAESGPARRKLGEFELLTQLGRGGMGVVYRAWQPSLGRQVALKKLLSSGDSKTEARFRREIRALGKVDHPHLVKIYLSGADGDQWFYAMELVEGANLSAVCDRLQTSTSGAADVNLQTWHETLSTVCVEARRAEKPLSDVPLTPPESSLATPEPSPSPTSPVARVGRSYVRHVVVLVQQVAKAAHALHEAGIVHRDIKPGNIMVTADGSQAVLMDLGLAQLADEVEGRLTRTRQFVGTLRYASPQQVLAVEKLDRRTDVYSLGATLWELLTLRSLYGATDQTPTPELMERIQREEPERVRKYHPGIPLDVDAIVLKCLEKDPKRRYATAQELGAELGRFLAGEPVQARSVGEVERFWRWCRRNPLEASLSSAVALLLILVASGAIIVAARERKAGEAAEAQRQVALELMREAGPGALYRVLQNLQSRQGTEDTRAVIAVYEEVLAMVENKAGWAPVETLDVIVDRSGHRFYRRLVRLVGPRKLVAVALAVPETGPDDPPTFYILESKVWNDLYDAFMRDPKAEELLRKYSGRPGCERLVRGDWRKGALAYGFNPDPDSAPFYGVEGPLQGRLPVFRVTATEAHCFAEWMDGRLPTRRQWQKAAGLGEGSFLKGPSERNVGENMEVAIGLTDGPWPVDRGKRDVSIYGCRQMASNGYEWTRELADDEPGKEMEIPLAEMIWPRQVFTQGQSYLAGEPLTFEALAKPRTRNCTDASFEVSFRIVLDSSMGRYRP
jgi:serine/threonine protein kinase